MKTLEQAAAISDEETGILREIQRTIHASLPSATVLLYGSVARGMQRPDSDYDILVLTDEELGSSQKDALRDAIYDFQLPRGILVSARFFSKAQWDTELYRAMPLHVEIDKDGILL